MNRDVKRVCRGCRKPMAPCTCGGTDFTYEFPCDVCGEAVESDKGGVSIDTDKGQLHVHRACIAEYKVACSVCGAVANSQGGYLTHDWQKHRDAAVGGASGPVP